MLQLNNSFESDYFYFLLQIFAVNEIDSISRNTHLNHVNKSI